MEARSRPAGDHGLLGNSDCTSSSYNTLLLGSEVSGEGTVPVEGQPPGKTWKAEPGPAGAREDGSGLRTSASITAWGAGSNTSSWTTPPGL